MKTIKLSKINLQAPTQLRLRENQNHIEDLAHIYSDQGAFSEMPWVALVKESEEFVPIDGFHRLMAIKWLQSQTDNPNNVDCTNVSIRYSEFDTMSQAIIAAAGVNSNHGLRRKKGDIANAIKTILEVDRIRFMETPYKLDCKAIMEVVKCSQQAFNQETIEVRKELEEKRDNLIRKLSASGISQREIATRTMVSQATVNRCRLAP